MAELSELDINAGIYFTPNAPIDRVARFAGRQEQLLGVIDAVNQKRQHVILYGERGVGKTSLSSVLSQYVSKSSIVCPKVNCGTTDSFGSVWMKLFSEIETVAETQVPALGKAVAQSRINASDFFDGNQTPNDVRKLLSRLSERTIPILIVDRFDRLPHAAKSVFADLAKMLSDHAVRATVVLVGVADNVDELIAEHGSVERALAQVRLPRMSQAEIGEIVERGMRELGLSIEQRALDRIVLLSQGLPHYAHLLGLYSVRSAASKQASESVMLSDVDYAIKRGLANAQQSIRNAYHKATTSPRADNLYKQVLCACAVAEIDELGYFAAADVRRPMRAITGRNYGIPAFARHLKQFCGDKRGCILQRIGTPRRYRFRFRNPLMQPFTVLRGLNSGMLPPEMLRVVRLARLRPQCPRHAARDRLDFGPVTHHNPQFRNFKSHF